MRYEKDRRKAAGLKIELELFFNIIFFKFFFNDATVNIDFFLLQNVMLHSSKSVVFELKTKKLWQHCSTYLSSLFVCSFVFSPLESINILLFVMQSVSTVSCSIESWSEKQSPARAH